jgi:hypothetical protein
MSEENKNTEQTKPAEQKELSGQELDKVVGGKMRPSDDYFIPGRSSRRPY